MIGTIWAIILICFCAMGTLFFSINVVALRTFSLGKLQDAFKEINNKENYEELAIYISEKAENFILSCWLFRLIFNMCIVMLLVDIFFVLNFSHQAWSYLFSAIIALLIFSTFSIAIPQAWAKYSGEVFLSRTYKILAFFTFISSPALYVFRLHDGIIRRLAGVTESTPQEQHEEKQEEFLTDLEQHKTEGALDEEEQEMIENVLELSNSTAVEIMTPRTDIIAIEVNSDLQKVIDTITEAGHTRVPVYEENIDNIVGCIYAKDLLSEIGQNPSDFKLREKIREPYFVPETKPLRILLHEFQNQKLHIAVVLDEYGGTAGIVTLEDILEELVGEIADEYEDTPTSPAKKIDENTIEADARTSVYDLNDEFELNLPEDEDYETIGGFVFSQLGYIPKTGEIFDYKNIKIEITAAEARKIKRIKINKIPQS
ncbi:MAG: HlyC/CorC family transporter [Sedimentisphaerales bacterium]|nr:HlyC/CorC family transporter [Sedimentisphaerales bacterium]